jgi:hypothetical protein
VPVFLEEWLELAVYFADVDRKLIDSFPLKMSITISFSVKFTKLISFRMGEFCVGVGRICFGNERHKWE